MVPTEGKAQVQSMSPCLVTRKSLRDILLAKSQLDLHLALESNMSLSVPVTQCNYDIYEQEFLGVYMPLMKYRPHLAATEIPVTILTDHANLLHWKLL